METPINNGLLSQKTLDDLRLVRELRAEADRLEREASDILRPICEAAKVRRDADEMQALIDAMPVGGVEYAFLRDFFRYEMKQAAMPREGPW